MPEVSLATLQKNLEGDRLYRQRRHMQWTENYVLDRDTVIVNRLTQRQSVNVPYMKETRKTYLAKTQAPPDLEFEELNNDGQKSLYLNAYWQDVFDRLKLKILDYIDRKQEFLYGRSFAKLNIVDGKFFLEILDPQDVLVDRYTNPWDIETADHLTHVGIFRRLADLELNPLYDKNVIAELKTFFAGDQGAIKAAENSRLAADKAERMLEMGVPDALTPLMGGTIIELNEHYYKVWDAEKKEIVVMVIVTAHGSNILMQKPLREILGVNFYPFCTWAGDVERTDFWSDGYGDTVRPLNHVANARWSQKVENGTLVNWGMQFYNSKANEQWSPIGYEPSPFGFYPLPFGDLDKNLKRVDIPEMKDMFGELDWIKAQIESFSATTAAEKGNVDQQDKTQTLGEFDALLKQADERLEAATPLREQYWKDIGKKFAALVNANADDMAEVTLYKKGASGKQFEKKLHPKMMKSEKGYQCKVTSQANREADDLKLITKLKVAQTVFPMNEPLAKIYKKKVLDYLKLSPEETREVMDFDEQNPVPPVQLGADGQPIEPAPPLNPAVKPRVSPNAVPSFIPKRQPVNANV